MGCFERNAFIGGFEKKMVKGKEWAGKLTIQLLQLLKSSDSPSIATTEQ